MSANIIKLSNPKDKLIVSQDFTRQYNNALAVCEEIKSEFEAEALSLGDITITEENIQTVKKAREDHNKIFNELDTQRKTIKSAYNTPVKNFEDKFKQTVRASHDFLKGKYDKLITDYEDKQKAEKTAEIKVYYDEYLAASGIVEDYGEFFSFETIELNINLSVSKKSLREQVKAFIDRISDDLALIKTQEHADEILYEYKRVGGNSYLSASTAIRSVDAKYKAIEETKAREAERQARRQAAAQAEKRVEQAAIPEPLEAPKPIAKAEKPVRVKFWVEAKPSEIRALKEYMNNGGIKYGNLN